MSSSTAFQPLLGSPGRLGLLYLGFILLNIANAYVFYYSKINAGTFIVRAMLPTIILYAIAFIIYARNQSIGGIGGGIFIFIIYVFYLTGMLAAKIPQRYIFEKIPSKVAPFFVFVFLGSVIWSRSLGDTATTVNGRVVADESLSPVGVAYVFGVCFIICFTVFWKTFRQRWALVALLPLPFLLTAIVGTASRGTVIAIAATIVITIVASIRDENGLGPKNIAKLLGGIFATVIIAYALFGDFLLRQIILLTSRLGGDRSAFNATNERLHTMQTYWDQFNEFYLFGLPRYAGVYPHNMFFELWVRFGALGLCIVAITIFAAIKAIKIFAVEKTSTWDGLMLSMFAFGLINGQTNLALEFNRVFWLGLAYFIHRRSTPIVIGRSRKSWQTWKSREYSRVPRTIAAVRD